MHKVAVAVALTVGAGWAMAQGLPPARPNVAPPVQLPLPQRSAADAQGGVPTGAVTAQPVALSLQQAIARGLRQNLAPILAASGNERARAQKLSAMAALLPNVEASAGELRQKINLAAFGFSFPGFPQIVGPFNVFQASASAHVPVVDLGALESTRAANNLQKAAADNLESVRNLVVLAVANQYLLSVADQSRVQAAQAELTTSTQALQQATDMLQAGTVGRLSVVRAQVQHDQQQQQLTAAENALAKQRLQLARAIGLPLEQSFTLTSTTPFAELAPPTPEAAVAQALATRADYRSVEAVERSAQLLVKSAEMQRLPTLSLDGNYGTIGHEIGSNHPIFAVGATVSVPVFEGGRIAAEKVAAEAQYHDAQARRADLKAAIAVEVRSALLDLESQKQQVGVAQHAQDLAQQELTLAQDRFRAGVADNLEVVQAQQAVAVADENYIAALYGYNLAKASLAQALGVASTQYQNYLPAK
ncbi:MAG TPA: TolC family protein [Terriglobales bacterium]|nr:TolC family protein [Terriglobales bacterium]